MAKIDAKGRLSGSAGPVSYRSYNGKTYVQSNPGKGNVKQTKATQLAASDFGRASSMAKAIRQSLFPVVQDMADNAFYRRFAARVHAATQEGNLAPKGSRNLMGGTVSLLRDIDANGQSPFGRYCKLLPEIAFSAANELHIDLPSFAVTENIAAYPGATHAELAVLITVLHPESGIHLQGQLFKLPINLNDAVVPAQQWHTAAIPQNHLVVVAAAVFYYRQNNLAGLVGLNNKDFHPCGVVGVWGS